MSYYVEVAEGGPWLGPDGRVVMSWDERGVWETEAEAQLAAEAAWTAATPKGEAR